MDKKLLLTISGTPGSGKSTIAKILSEKLKAHRIYVGGIRRELARQKEMTIEELNQYALEHPETDVEIDKKAAAQAREAFKKTSVIVEGRTQFHFLPESIKIYIKVSFAEGAKRIWKQIQNDKERGIRNEHVPDSIENMQIQLKERQKNDRVRYQKYYQLDHTDESQYDLIVDTSDISAQEAVQKIVDFISK
ncbi:AAA family ATPase [bacterium]|jgi:predicted cytidylate kinase|nr:AAA family ATPase [bacterium]